MYWVYYLLSSIMCTGGLLWLVYRVHSARYPKNIRITSFSVGYTTFHTHIQVHVTWDGCQVIKPVLFSGDIPRLSRTVLYWRSEYANHFTVPAGVLAALNDRVRQYHEDRDNELKRRYVESMSP